MRLTAEKRTELNRVTLRGAMHDVGIFIGVLFAVDKLFEIESRFQVGLKALIYKLCEAPFAGLKALIYKLGETPFAWFALIVTTIIFLPGHYPSPRLEIDEVPRKGTRAR